MIPGKYHGYIIVVISHLIICTSITSCSTFPPPHKIHDSLIPQVHSEPSALIIGCVILHGFTKHRPYLVALAYKEKADSRRVHSIFVTTDSLGYFALSNVPNGYYALHALQTRKDVSWLYKSETLRGDVFYSGSYGINGGGHFGDVPHFPLPRNPISWSTPGRGYIHDLGYTIIEAPLLGGGSPRYYRRAHQHSTLPDLDLEDIQTGFRSSVPQYFIEKYPQSEWVQYLERIIP